MTVDEEHRCQAGIVPAFARLMGTDRDKGSKPVLQLCKPVLSPRKGPLAPLATGDLAGDMEPLAVTALEGAEDVIPSGAKVEGVEKAVATEEVESPEGAGLGGDVVTPGGATALEASENPEAERVAAAFVRAAERVAISEVAKVLQSAIAELKEKRRSTWLKPSNTTQQEEEE